MSKSNDSASLRLPFSSGKSYSSILPTPQIAAHDMVSIGNSIQSLVATSNNSNKPNTNIKVSSILNDIESFAESDQYSKCEALRREDGTLRIFITGKDWDKGTIAEHLGDPSAEDEIVISASRKIDPTGAQVISVEVKRFQDIESNLYEDDEAPVTNTNKQHEAVEKHNITISSSGKVKTSFPADHKFEVLNGIDALKSTVRRLQELELYREQGVLENKEDAESVLRKLHVYDNFDPGQSEDSADEEELKDMERQLSDISRILQMVE